MKSLFTQEKMGCLRVERKDLDECSSTHVELALTADIPPVGEIGSPLDDGPPRWKEAQEIVHCARSTSAPGPNGVPYVYKGVSDVFNLRMLRQAGGTFSF